MTHIEGGPDCTWYPVKVTEEVFYTMGAVSVDWGKPDSEGFYTPTIRGDYKNKLAKIREYVQPHTECWFAECTMDPDDILEILDEGVPR
jgi:hypothetical protein